jgi:hypothetical protein
MVFCFTTYRGFFFGFYNLPEKQKLRWKKQQNLRWEDLFYTFLVVLRTRVHFAATFWV